MICMQIIFNMFSFTVCFHEMLQKILMQYLTCIPQIYSFYKL